MLEAHHAGGRLGRFPNNTGSSPTHFLAVQPSKNVDRLGRRSITSKSTASKHGLPRAATIPAARQLPARRSRRRLTPSRGRTWVEHQKRRRWCTSSTCLGPSRSRTGRRPWLLRCQTRSSRRSPTAPCSYRRVLNMSAARCTVVRQRASQGAILRCRILHGRARLGKRCELKSGPDKAAKINIVAIFNKV